MTNGVIAVSHASLASGVYSAIKMVAGEFNNIKIEEFKKNQSYEDFDQRIEAAYNSLADSCKNIIVFADMAGGTPFNRAVLTLGKFPNVKVLAGLNFAGLYKALELETENIDNLVEEIIEYSKQSLMAF